MLGDLFRDSRERIHAALKWLALSQDATAGGGSAAWYAPFYGWADPYPETTGYIIPTLWRGADFLAETEYATRAERMARWLVSIQSDEGWFPRGKWQRTRASTPSVFNTAQILFGLVEAASRLDDPAFRHAADKAALWLVATQDADGLWSRNTFVPGHVPSYHAHMCWPLALYWKRFGGDQVHDSTCRGMAAILKDFTPAGTFSRWAFAPDVPAFTHTIGYTLQGFLETALLVDAWESYGAAAVSSCDRLMRKAEFGGLAGAYGREWAPVSGFICLTGHCQIASAWMRVYERTQDPRFLNAALKAVAQVCRHQRLAAWPAARRGAIAGSAPLWGTYLRWRYPNWAAKFFVDAMLEGHHHLATLAAEPAPDNHAQ